jgi:hypothetical protein
LPDAVIWSGCLGDRDDMYGFLWLDYLPEALGEELVAGKRFLNCNDDFMVSS